jgi:UDP-N-acetylmuramoyl-tripeptide--D-alanyl-D-alanine ligase
MIPTSIVHVARATAGVVAESLPESLLVTGQVRIDSRDVGPGDLFVAVRGNRVDGHDFVNQARQQGAVAAIVDHAVESSLAQIVVGDTLDALTALAADHARRLPATCSVIGITGSSGKTTTKDLLAQVLETDGPTIAPPGSFNNEIGLPLTVLRADQDTRFLVLEMGARGLGHIAHLVDVAQPSMGIVLNVGSAHASEFGGPEVTAQAKGELVEGLPSSGHAVLNGDDPRVLAMAARTNAHSTFFGESATCDVRATDVQTDDEARAHFVLEWMGQSADVALPIPGRHMVSNALAVAAAALTWGIDLQEVARRLSEAVPRSRWRMEVTRRPDGATVVNDAYNANPESVAAALSSVGSMVRSGRLVAVLGEMRELGERTVDDHRAAGRAAAEVGVDLLIAVGPDAITQALADGAGSAAGASVPVVRRVSDAEAAVEALGEIAAGDVVLIKASRAVGLERVAEQLLSAGGAA